MGTGEYPGEESVRRLALRKSGAAASLRLAGASFNDIAETLGLASGSVARNEVERYLAGQISPEQRDNLRVEEAARIERLLRGVWGKATDPKDPEHLPAVKVALSLVDRHSRLLGLDAPQEVVVYSPAQQEIETWVNDMLGKAQGLVDVDEADIVDADVVEGEVADVG